MSDSLPPEMIFALLGRGGHRQAVGLALAWLIVRGAWRQWSDRLRRGETFPSLP